ncbi:hypothetical protein BY996DRAFT_6414297 [Phakopsora pachyrhizi]|nr:hypothetical protein BY996DRAFT_6414297 [Phakopsora pachyrhizi]
MEPIIIEDSDCLNSLGMRMPKSDLTIREISDIVGPKTPVEVMDVASQSELSRWTLDDWATYFEQPNRDRIRNVISLEVSETELGKMIQLPRIVRQMDWVQTIWPDELKVHGSLNYPKVQKYCLMSVARCWTDWHVDFAGSSVFYHILRGMKVFYFIRPTVANLSKYEKWSGNSELQESTWLGDQVNVVYKVTLQAGDTMIIPTGWIHAVYTPTDSLVFGGNYLHSLNIPTQLRIHQIENNTKVPKKFRFPFFSSSLWLVANHYLNRLKRRTMENDKKQDLDNQTQGHKDLDNVEVIPDRVLSGLLTLSGFLIDQSEGVGTDVKDSLSFLEARSIIKENLNCDQQLNSKLYPIAHELNRLVKLSLKKLPTPSSQSTSSSVSAAPATTTTTTTTKPNGLLIHLKRKASQNEKERSKSTNDAAEAQATAQNGSSKKIKITQSNPTRNSINNKNNSSNTNGKKDLGEIIFRSNEVPSTKVEIQRRKVPNYDADWEKKENEEVRADGEEEDVEGVEVRTTGAQNKVVRRYLDDDGRMVFEVELILNK